MQPGALLERLDTAIASERDPIEQLLLGAERAMLLAREGRQGDARRALLELQARHAADPHAAGAAALMLADALGAYFSDLSAEARAKLQQARALAVSAQRPVLQALCAAWLAHLDYADNDIPGMARNAAQALTLAAPDHHAARSRASLVVAMAYHHAGRLDLAQPWYDAARRHAQAERDGATLSALLYNMAAIRVDLARRAAVSGDGDGGQAAMIALAAAESASHFDDHRGACGLPLLEPLLRAQALSILGRWEQALSLYEPHLSEMLSGGLVRIEASVRADMAYCRLQLGQPALARLQAEAAAAAARRPGCHVDDLAFSHGRLAQVHAGLGNTTALARRHAEQAQQCWQRHAKEQARIVAVMNAAVAVVV